MIPTVEDGFEEGFLLKERRKVQKSKSVNGKRWNSNGFYSFH